MEGLILILSRIKGRLSTVKLLWFAACDPRRSVVLQRRGKTICGLILRFHEGAPTSWCRSGPGLKNMGGWRKQVRLVESIAPLS